MKKIINFDKFSKLNIKISKKNLSPKRGTEKKNIAYGPHAANEAKLCGPRSHIHFNSISGINEIMKPECTV